MYYIGRDYPGSPTKEAAGLLSTEYMWYVGRSVSHWFFSRFCDQPFLPRTLYAIVSFRWLAPLLEYVLTYIQPAWRMIRNFTVSQKGI